MKSIIVLPTKAKKESVDFTSPFFSIALNQPLQWTPVSILSILPLYDRIGPIPNLSSIST
jgi:hypothetical protein